MEEMRTLAPSPSRYGSKLRLKGFPLNDMFGQEATAIVSNEAAGLTEARKRRAFRGLPMPGVRGAHVRAGGGRPDGPFSGLFSDGAVRYAETGIVAEPRTTCITTGMRRMVSRLGSFAPPAERPAAGRAWAGMTPRRSVAWRASRVRPLLSWGIRRGP